MSVYVNEYLQSVPRVDQFDSEVSLERLIFTELQVAALSATHSPLLASLYGMERNLDAAIRQQRHAIQQAHDVRIASLNPMVRGDEMQSEPEVKVEGISESNVPLEPSTEQTSPSLLSDRKELCINVYLTHYNQIPSYHLTSVREIHCNFLNIR